MNSPSCIPDDRLRELLLGELTEQESQPLEQHLLACPSCVARTRSLRSADTLVSALAGGLADADDSPSADIDRVMQQLTDRSHLATHLSLLDETQTLAAKSAAGNVSDLVARFEPPQAPDELGRLGDFRILKLLGQGGMGAVFLAEDTQLRRPVALKLLRPEQAVQPGSAERFLREARAAAAVKHDHVVTIYQVSQAHGLPFIAEELLEGESLEDCLKREHKIPIGEALRIGREIAAGLAAAHARGVLHRDVKPANVFLQAASGDWSFVSGQQRIGDHSPLTTYHSRGARTKLLDFGLARQLQGNEQLTHSGAIVGTPAYMSPEQAQGRDLDPRSDLFSLGGVLYRMVTGRLPFQGTDVLSILRSLAVDDPPLAHSLNKEVPAELSTLIAELLHKNRDQRPASAAAVAARLAEIEAARGRRVAGSGKRPPSTKWLIGLSAAAAVLLALAVFLTIKTPHGEITVELGPGVKPDEVRIEVERDNEVRIADARRGWNIVVKEGQYNVQLTGGKDKLEINQRSVTVVRNEKTHLKVTLKPLAVAADPADAAGSRKPQRSDGSDGSTFAGLDFSPQANGIPAHVNLFDIDPSQPITVELYFSLQPNTGTKRGGISVPLFSAEWSLDLKRNAPSDTIFWQAWDRKQEKLEQERVFSPAIPLNQRVHLAAISTGRELRMYLDGRLCDKRKINVQLSNRNVPIKFGASWDDRDPLNATFDEARISKVARYARDFSPPQAFENDANTLALYHFDEGQGDVLTDASGNGHHGKIVNARWVQGVADGPAAEHGLLPEPSRAIAPFTTSEARVHQRAWAKYLGVPVEWENSIGMKFVLIPPGEFTMGATKDEINAALYVLRTSEKEWIERAQGSGPEHRVALTQPIYLAVHEVTQAHYREVTGQSPSFFAATGEQPDKVDLVAGIDTARHPVEGVTWNDAAAFCLKLSERERLPPRYEVSGESVTLLGGRGYQLPTEATWEYACRAGTQTKYYSGSHEKDLGRAGWYGKNSGKQPHAVGELSPNAFGLYDMHGNVMEWCQDGWDADSYQLAGTSTARDPAVPPTGTHRTTRGGGWGNFSCVCASGFRCEAANHRSIIIGFRVALPVVAVKQALEERARTYGLEFNGLDSYVELPTLLYDGSHAITIEAWATPAASREKGYPFVLDNVDDSFEDGQYWPAGIGLQQRAPANGAPNCWGAWVSTAVLPKGQNQMVGAPQQWAIHRMAHLALQLNKDRAQFFIDGQLVEDQRLDAAQRASDKHFAIGQRFAGRISEVRVSQAARYVDRFTPETRLEADDDTLALYHFDEGEGDVLTDASGHGHHGKIVNAKWVPAFPSAAPRP